MTDELNRRVAEKVGDEGGVSLPFGTPIIRQGDNVYIINSMPSFLSRENIEDQAERMLLRWQEYRCPFSFLGEFEQWWEWHKRKHADKQPTGTIMVSMVHDVERIKAHKIEKRGIPFRLTDYGVSVLDSYRGFLARSAF